MVQKAMELDKSTKECVQISKVSKDWILNPPKLRSWENNKEAANDIETEWPVRGKAKESTAYCKSPGKGVLLMEASMSTAAARAPAWDLSPQFSNIEGEGGR